MMRLCFFVYLRAHRTLHVGYIHLYLLRERKKLYKTTMKCAVSFIFHLYLKVQNIRCLLLLQKHHLVLLWILKLLIRRSYCKTLFTGFSALPTCFFFSLYIPFLPFFYLLCGSLWLLEKCTVFSHTLCHSTVNTG